MTSNLATGASSGASEINPQEHPDYTILVGAGQFSGFADKYAPDTLPQGATPETYVIGSAHSNLDKSRVKVFIPPGARMLRIGVVTYKVNQPALAAAKMLIPPVSDGSDINADTQIEDARKTLELLVGGSELKFYSPEESGTLVMATSESGGSFKSDVGGYVYINFYTIPGGSLMSYSVQVEVDKNDYTSWYSQDNIWTSSGDPRADIHHSLQSLQSRADISGSVIDIDATLYEVSPLGRQYVDLHTVNVKTFRAEPSGDDFVGFKKRFDPEALTVNNSPSYNNGRPYYEVSFAADNNYWEFYPQFRVFLPPGTIFFGGSWFLPQSSQEILILNLKDTPDASDIPLGDYETLKALNDYKQGWLSLLNSETISSVHNGVGSIGVTRVAFRNKEYPGRERGFTIEDSGWLYVKEVLASGQPYRDFSFSYEIDKETYDSWYSGVAWSDTGEPLSYSPLGGDEQDFNSQYRTDTGVGSFASYNGNTGVTKTATGVSSKPPVAETLSAIKDNIPLNLIYRVIKDSNMKSTFAFETVIHTKNANLTYTDGIFLMSLAVCRDYENAMTDYMEARFSIPLGTFIEDIYPYLENCEVTLRVRKQFSQPGIIPKPVISAERYKAVFLKDKNNVVPNNKTQSKADMNQQLPGVITLQLLDRSAEAIRIKTTAGGVKYTANTSTATKPGAQGYLESVFTQECKKILIDGKPILPVVKVIKPDNNSVPKIATPSYTRIIEIPDYIQEKSQGLYNTSVGCYVQRFMDKVGSYKTGIYVYPVYKTKKTDTGVTTIKLNALTATAPALTTPGLVFKDGLYYGVCDKPMVKEADKESQVMSEGTGFRVANAESVMKRPYLIHKDGPVFSRQKLNTEVIFKERDDGVNFAVNKGVYTNNLVLASEVNAKKANFLTIKMHNLDHDLIRPDMNVMLVSDFMTRQSGDGKTKREVKTYRCSILQMRVDYTNTNHNPVFSRNSKFTELTSSATLRACYEIDGET